MRKAILYAVIMILLSSYIYTAECIQVPFYAEEHLLKGNEHFSKQQYDKAIQEYKDAILFAKDYDEAYFRLGYVYMVLNNFEDAKVNFEQAITLRTNYLEAHYCLAQIYPKLRNSDPDKALEHSLKANDLIDEDTPKLIKLGTYTAIANCYREI